MVSRSGTPSGRLASRRSSRSASSRGERAARTRGDLVLPLHFSAEKVELGGLPRLLPQANALQLRVGLLHVSVAISAPASASSASR